MHHFNSKVPICFVVHIHIINCGRHFQIQPSLIQKNYLWLTSLSDHAAHAGGPTTCVQRFVTTHLLSCYISISLYTSQIIIYYFTIFQKRCTFNVVFPIKRVLTPDPCNTGEMKRMGVWPPLCTYRLNWVRRTSWGWRDDTALHTQDSKFEPWRSEVELVTYIIEFLRVSGEETFFSFKLEWDSNPRSPTF